MKPSKGGMFVIADPADVCDALALLRQTCALRFDTEVLIEAVKGTRRQLSCLAAT